MRQLIFVSSNLHKFQEIQSITADLDPNLEIIFQQMELKEIQADTLQEVASYSVETFPDSLEKIFVEDAGLFIPSLGGFPGPYSSFVLKTIGIEGILRLLEGNEDRAAEFGSVIALKERTQIHCFEGKVLGTISQEIRGTKGWGFDPIFIPKANSQTFAEMNRSQKNMISHRRKSLEKLVRFCIGKRSTKEEHK